jgi:DNA repair protein RadC
MRQLPPREKMAQSGIDALSDAELLAILLRTGAARVPATHLAGTLLMGFGGLLAIFDSRYSRLRVRASAAPRKTAAVGDVGV